VRDSILHKLRAVAFISFAVIVGCDQSQRKIMMLNHHETEAAVAELRAAYAAFNRGDIDAAVRFLDPQIEWVEPTEFPRGGTYRGVEGAKRYLRQSRAGAAEVISTPERFIWAGDRVVVFVHARVLPKNSDAWQEVRLADVYTIQGGRATKMHAFANRDDALRWVNIDDLSK
jgi:ketosteroid isomerase-like protein